MQFFLYEIVARIVAIYLFFDCSRKLWYGLKERKIAYFNSDPSASRTMKQFVVSIVQGSDERRASPASR